MYVLVIEICLHMLIPELCNTVCQGNIFAVLNSGMSYAACKIFLQPNSYQQFFILMDSLL